MRDHGIEPIDLVVISLYPFEQTIAREGATLEEAIEQIDIGGPAMIRSAAKNWQHVAVVVLPEDCASVIKEMKSNDGALSLDTRSSWAEGFRTNVVYDAMITPLRAFSQAKQERRIETHWE